MVSCAEVVMDLPHKTSLSFRNSWDTEWSCWKYCWQLALFTAKRKNTPKYLSYLLRNSTDSDKIWHI